MANYSLNVYSNDGKSYVGGFTLSSNATCTVTDWGVRRTYSSKYYGERFVSFNKTLLGLAKSPNATTPTYAVGSTFSLSSSGVTLYVVEADAEPVKDSFELSSLELPVGTHNITVKAKANGYADSLKSETVEYVVEAVNLITFTINGTSYQAESGMTWADWVESEYSTGGYYINERNGYVCVEGTKLALYSDDYDDGAGNTHYAYKDSIVPAGVVWYTSSDGN